MQQFLCTTVAIQQEDCELKAEVCAYVAARLTALGFAPLKTTL